MLELAMDRVRSAGVMERVEPVAAPVEAWGAAGYHVQLLPLRITTPVSRRMGCPLGNGGSERN